MNELISLALLNLSNNQFSAGKAIIERILSQAPKHILANEIYSEIMLSNGNRKAALKHLLIVCDQKECSAESLYKVGSIYLIEKNYQRGISFLKRALEKRLNYFDALYDLGSAYAFIKDFNASIQYFLKALELDSKNPELLFNIGLNLQEQGRHNESLNFYNKSLEIDNTNAETYNSIGLIMLKEYSLSLAREYLEKALSFSKENHRLFNNYGLLLHNNGEFINSINYFNKAISLNQSFWEAHANKSASLISLQKFSEAVNCQEVAYQINPEAPYLLGNLMYTKMLAGIFPSQQFKESLMRKIKSGSKVISPFMLLAIEDSPEIQHKVSLIWSKEKYDFIKPLPYNLPIKKKSKIKISYISADFFSHPVSYLCAGLFKAHNRDQFEVFGIALNKPNYQDTMTLRLSQSFDHFADFSNLSDKEVAEECRKLNIDIAVDLGCHTDRSRVGVFAYRAAPIQINYLGYPGTSGTKFHDYIIADKIVIPDNFIDFYSEKIVFLQNSFQVNDPKRFRPKGIASRSQFNLPDGGFIFCCMNATYKLNIDMFQHWARILLGSPNSYLLLLSPPDSNASFYAIFEAFGINRARILFSERLNYEDYLSQYSVLDLFLDTLPFNAGTTSSDALWSGLPVLTCLGNSFSGRMGASILNALDLNELITTSFDQYEKLAINLSSSPEKMNALKEKLICNRDILPLFNLPLFVKNLESAYLHMHKRFSQFLPFDHIRM